MWGPEGPPKSRTTEGLAHVPTCWGHVQHERGVGSPCCADSEAQPLQGQSSFLLPFSLTHPQRPPALQDRAWGPVLERVTAGRRPEARPRCQHHPETLRGRCLPPASQARRGCCPQAHPKETSREVACCRGDSNQWLYPSDLPSPPEPTSTATPQGYTGTPEEGRRARPADPQVTRPARPLPLALPGPGRPTPCGPGIHGGAAREA